MAKVAKTEEGQPVPVTIKIGIETDDDTSVVYANHVEISHSIHDFCISFARVPSKLSSEKLEELKNDLKIDVPALIQVVVPPTLIAGLIRALVDQRDMYENNFTKIPDGDRHE